MFIDLVKTVKVVPKTVELHEHMKMFDVSAVNVTGRLDWFKESKVLCVHEQFSVFTYV